jgi:GNAT superfamily N-acetyltransferase
VAIPTDDGAWKELIRSGQPPGWRVIAESTGGSVWKDDGVFAAIIPATPRRSIFNSVFYREGDALLGRLDDVSAAYDAAGVEAWTVWVPEEDRETASGLEAAGHLLDAEPHDMAMALSDLQEPHPDPELEIVEREDYPAMSRINATAYGWPIEDFGPVERTRVPGFRIYFASVGGEEMGTLAIGPVGTDAIVAWVAVLPEGRGRGISGRILARALRDARAAGLETTTLQATKLGFPVYEQLGYRDFGVVQMWERRKPG